MRKRPSQTLAGLLATAFGRLVAFAAPIKPAEQPVGGPVVFRHYL
ncbi:hypothetical protein [Methylobacterium aerolatum]|uniref:Uncharacterized protein n=1 Tax=Methylobacterium aerolatum TaxID=418708 RepID=A0ABU0I0V5_9HYPH|nr:hypothetical protein [Methylobacterium aerolatum]MDQ0448239.1 hypothetical protein [Methylobacterium aerolatum]GJD33895.1 hypothetical protein FMGBMHLM_0790 [Methylobacterium aerolatum]